MKIAVLPGDGISHEIVPHAVGVLRALPEVGGKFEFEEEHRHSADSTQ